MSDLNYEKCMNTLEKIHNDFPDLMFTDVLQESADLAKKQTNVNFTNLSSKQFNLYLESFYEQTKKKRGLD